MHALKRVTGAAQHAARTITSKADGIGRRLSPRYRANRKYAAELQYWKNELAHLWKWFEERTIDWWGLPSPAPGQRRDLSTIWAVNAVATMHAVRPTYLEELRLERNAFRGQRVLEVGCGPLAPVLQFENCVRHGIDPLVNLYMQSGWPLYDYDAKFVSAPAEAMPYAASYFDAVISVNALDHVDDFSQVAAEMQRVVKVGGNVCFEIEYHAPTVTEPQRLNDDRVLSAFSKCDLSKILERGKKDMFQAQAQRFGLLSTLFEDFTNDDRFVTWHGRRVR